MKVYWLNLFFRFSGYTFRLKQKIVQADNWLVVLPYTFLLIISELGFMIVSLPVYILVPPKKVQEEGLIFPKAVKDKRPVQVYIFRRKISLFTFLIAGGVWLAKIALIGAISYFLWGAQQILADTQNWGFGNPGDYTYDSAKIEITSGVARLKDLGSTTSGSTTNSGFNTDAVGWTGADWGAGGGEVNPTETRITTGGNPGAYINISAPAGSSDELGGYWRQPFTTTVANPTTTLSFDWEVTAYDSTPAPLAFKLYVFVDTGSGAPVIGQEVWSSATITGTSGWASVANLDVSSKVTAAGIYYLKVAMWVETPGSASGPFTVGYDNVVLNWTKTTHIYASDKPTVVPVAPLSMPKTVSWNSFAETATKNGGEIYYQLSADNGTNWKFWNGLAWSTSTLATDYNIASVINSNIGSFTTSTNQLKWQAFLVSDSTQQVILSSIVIDYTPNNRPSILSVLPSQQTDDGQIDILYSLQDVESDLSSLSAYDFSTDSINWLPMTASTTDPTHSGIINLTATPAGTAHTFVWDAFANLGAIYNANTYVRLRANDVIGDGLYTTSSAFAVDFVSPVISNVSSTELLNSTDVQVTYDLSDNTSDNLNVLLEVSSDSGGTWTVPVASAVGAVGSGVSTGSNKTITWHAGVDYPNNQLSTMRVRLRATDKFQNQADFVTSTVDFSLDTLPPAVLATANLIGQPNAGDTTVLIGGSFTEINPSTNTFYAEITNGGYSTGTLGTTDTASPANQVTEVDALRGNDYISKVKIIHTDDYGQATANENTAPSVAFKYVKPYTPAAPTLSNPVTTRLDLTVNPNVNEANGLEYAIFVSSSNQYVQSDGTLGASPVWQTLGIGSGQWGQGLGISGQVRVTGLSSPVALYVFKVKSRNVSDTAHAASSESSFSSSAQITNTAPSIVFDSYSQTTDGTDYVTIAYTGTDGQGDISSVPTYQYSTDNSNWFTMTEKSGVGSSGTSSLVYLPTSSNYNFMWDSNTDLPNTEISTARIRLKPNDSLVDGNLVTSNAFSVDNKVPVVSGVSALQGAGTRTVTFTYTLTDANNSFVDLQVSADGGSTWTVATTTVSGAVGSGVTPGAGKTITWNAGTDFNGQYNTGMLVKIRARDIFGNQGVYDLSSAFTVDTHAPTISNITAVEDSATNTFTFHYDVSEDIGNAVIVLAISSNGGSTWVVPTSTALGDVGSVIPGANKTITWDAGTNYNSQEKTNMEIRLTANDQYNNQSVNPSADFSLDTLAPRVTNVSAAQPLATTTVTITYDLADQNNSLVAVDISADGGTNWEVATSTLLGAVGDNTTPATGKTITWNPKIDFNNQTLSTMKVRVRANDIFNNQSANVNSTNFALDTLPPATFVVADLQVQPNAGDTTVLISGSFTEANPNTNDFYLAIDGGAYGSATAGAGNTATPSDQATAVGVALKGNNYISKVKLTHTDDHGQVTDNENISPSLSFKYVKPYTPQAPTVDNPGVGTVDVIINPNVDEASGLEYAIFENTTNQYVQSNGTLGVSPIWQTLGTGSGQWGNNSGVYAKVSVNGLTKASYKHEFQVKSRNISDSGHAVSSESTLSSGASSMNQSPTINFNSLFQTTDGSKYVDINYHGIDLESDTSTLVVYKYSTDGTNYFTMSEKSGVGSDGINNLMFTHNPGVDLHFMWDVGVDLPNTEDSTVYVKMQANDGTTSGGVAISSNFTIDTKNPVISSVTASQTNGTNNVAISYTLTDLSISTVELNISSDGGSTWAVATTSVSGDVGVNVNPGSDKIITWNAGADFVGQEVNNMKVRLRAVDAYDNVGSFSAPVNFDIDTLAPRVTTVTASQISASNTVVINYNLADANDSTVVVEISSDNGSTWVVPTSTLTGAVGIGMTPGSKTIYWNATVDFPEHQNSSMIVRVRAVDIFNNSSGNINSAVFSIDTTAPNVNTVSAIETIGTQNVSITYNLVDANNATVAFDVSSDGGFTWVVPHTSVTGDVGTGIIPGSNKNIVWNAGADYSDQQVSNMMVRVRATDTFNNTGANVNSTAFGLDTLAPVADVTVNLQAQPNAGDTTALVGGSFTEANPNVSNFFVAVNGGAYGSTTTGQGNTASPANQAVNLGTALTGNDYISKVKIVHTDDYGQSVTNENITPSTTFKYVKPYTPEAPTVDNPQNTSVDLTINAHAGESVDIEYAILEVSTGKYVQTNGTLSSSTVWKTLGTGLGQWGNSSGISGKINVNSLVSPVANYSFEVKSRNPQDTTHQLSSESDLSVSVGISNTAPIIAISSANQPDSTNYVVINYTGTDGQNDTNNLTVYEFSTNTVNWQAMTEKSGVGSSGINNLVFSSTSANYNFAWDIAVDLPNTEAPTVYVRLQSTDTLTNSNLAVSSAFAVDTLGPVISNFNISQTPGTKNIIIDYDLLDNSGNDNTVILQISDDGGFTWDIPTTTLSGDVGAGVSSGVGKSAAWNAGVDFNNQENNLMKVRAIGTDRFGNVGNLSTSNNFDVDTKNPVVSSVSASQTAGSANVVINYTLSDITTAGNFVDLEISSNGGSTWLVPSTTVSGDVGAGQTTGSKTITWNAGADFNNQENNLMKVRVRARDYFANQGTFTQSANFDLDTQSPIISNLSAVQNSGSTNVVISYDLADQNASGLGVELQVSDNGGSNWTVPVVTIIGNVGTGQTTGNNKIITWLAGTDFAGQFSANMRVRLQALDTFGNLSSNFSSSDFVFDTKAPVGLTTISKFSSTANTVTLNWSSGVSDASFDHYEIWHGSNESDVQNRTSTANKWSIANDANLSNINTISTVLTGLSLSNNYYVKIWAVDNFGSEATINDINIFEIPPVVTPVAVANAGGGTIIANALPPIAPILTSLNSPINTARVLLSGLAEPRVRIDVYDNGVFLSRLNSVVDNFGNFSQALTLTEGLHNLKVRAVDFNNNQSLDSNSVSVEIITGLPSAPLVSNLENNETITVATPTLIGTAKPLSNVEIILDNKDKFTTIVDANGDWTFLVPDTAALESGAHNVVLRTIDNAGNFSSVTALSINKITSPAIPGILGTPSQPLISAVVPAPTSEIIQASTVAREIASLAPPKVTSNGLLPVTTAGGELIRFTGTALPNQEVVIYIHSNQALIYNTKADSKGVWSFEHNQNITELTPGEHTIYAVALDPDAKVKSRPSVVSSFTVKRNFWVMIYKYLDWRTTIFTLVILILAILWLYHIRNRRMA